MNWIGGARSRVKAANDKKKQREFFEKQRKQASSSNATESLSVSSLSHDLITFYLKQRNSKQGSALSKPTKIIKQNLEKRPDYFILHATRETPLEDDTALKNKTLKNSRGVCKSKFVNEIGTELCPNRQTSPSQTKIYQASLDSDSNIVDAYDIDKITDEYTEKYGDENTNDLSIQPENAVSEESWPKTGEQFTDISNTCDEVADMNQMKRDGKVNDNFRPDNEYFNKFPPNIEDKNAFFDIFLHKTLKEINTEKPFHSKTSKLENRSKKKMKILDKMSSYFYNHEKKNKGLNAVLHKSKLSYSKISQCTVDSMPLKVSRDIGHSSNSEPTYDYRQSLDDLETMIENCDLKLKKRKGSDVYDSFWSVYPHDKTNTSSNAQLSSTDSTSSSSSPSTIYSCTNMNNDPMQLTKCMPSYGMFRANLKQSESLKLKNGMLSHRKKIKLSNTRLKDSFERGPDFQKKFKPYRFDQVDNSKSKNIQKPSSLLSYFPSPKILRSQDQQNASPAYLGMFPKHTNDDFSFQNPPTRVIEESSDLLSKTLKSRDKQNTNHANFDVFPEPTNCDVSIQTPYVKGTNESSKFPPRSLKRQDQQNSCHSPLNQLHFHPTPKVSLKRFSLWNMDEPTNSTPNVVTSKDSQTERISSEKVPKHGNINVSFQNSPMQSVCHSQTSSTYVLTSPYKQITNHSLLDSTRSTDDGSSDKYTSTSTQTRFEKINVFTETTALNSCPTCCAPKINAATSPFENFHSTPSNTKEHFNCFANGGKEERVSSCTTENRLDIYSISECAKSNSSMSLSDHGQNHLKNCNQYANCNTQFENDENEIGKCIKEEKQNEFKNIKKLPSKANSPAMNEINIANTFVAAEKQMDRCITGKNNLENSVIITNTDTQGELNDNTKGSTWNQFNSTNTFIPAETQMHRYSITDQNHLENSLITINIETESEPRDSTKGGRSLPSTEPNSPSITVEGIIKEYPYGNVLLCNNEDPLPTTVPNTPDLNNRNGICSPGTTVPSIPFLKKGINCEGYYKNCSIGTNEIHETKTFLQPDNPECLQTFDEKRKADSSLENVRRFFNAIDENDRKLSDHATFSKEKDKCFVENMNNLPSDVIVNSDLTSFRQNIKDKEHEKISDRSVSENMSKKCFNEKNEGNFFYESDNNFILPFSQHSLITTKIGYKKISVNSNANMQEYLENDSAGQEKTSDVLLANSSLDTTKTGCIEIHSNSKAINLAECLDENDKGVSAGQEKTSGVLSFATSSLGTTDANFRKISGISIVNMGDYNTENYEDSSVGRGKRSDAILFVNSLRTLETNYPNIPGNSKVTKREYFTENYENASTAQSTNTNAYLFVSSSLASEDLRFANEKCRFVENDFSCQTNQIGEKKTRILANIDRFLKSMDNSNFDPMSEAVDVRENYSLENKDK